MKLSHRRNLEYFDEILFPHSTTIFSVNLLHGFSVPHFKTIVLNLGGVLVWANLVSNPNFKFPAFLCGFQLALINEHFFLLGVHFPLSPYHGFRVWTGLSKFISILYWVVTSGIGNWSEPCLTSPQSLVGVNNGSQFPSQVELIASTYRITNPNMLFILVFFK